jgi:nucleotide-binding universal stress UspA family protein
MEPRTHTDLEAQAERRVLIVADWSLDSSAVMTEVMLRARDRGTVFGLLVPAALHGLDWTGEPHVSEPCARRQLETLRALAAGAGIPVAAASIGDPEAAPAVGDALLDWPADEILLFGRRRRLEVVHPLSLARRVARTARVPVTSIGVPAAVSRRPLQLSPQCATAEAAATAR